MRKHKSVLGGVLLALLPAVIGRAQSSRETYIPTVIEVDQSRPLVPVLGRLQEIYKVPINFEEAAYENASDLGFQDIATQTGLLRRAFPRRGTLKVTIGQSESASPYLGVQAALLAHISSGLGGVYQIAQGPGTLTVYPTQVSATNGLLKKVTPVMSQKISFPTSERSAMTTLELMMAQLAAASGTQIKAGSVDLPDDQNITLGSLSEPAADVLAKLTAQLLRSPASYCLLYDPSEKTYYLSIRTVSGFRPGIISTAHRPTANQTGVEQPSSFFTKDK